MSKHCKWDMTECWHVRTHPIIESISHSEGYTSGKQLLTLTGYGLTGDDLAITAAGQPCEIISQTDTQVVCKTASSPDVSVLGPQPGVKGLRAKEIDPSNDGTYPSYNDILNENYDVVDEFLITQSETIQNTMHRAGRKMTGYFRAPATGNFRFRLSCDDHCYLNFDITPYNAASPVDPVYTQVASRHWASNWRFNFREDYDDESHSPNSDWFSLTEGEYYPMQAIHGQYNSDEHFTLAFEYEQADSSAHYHAKRTVQRLRIDQTNVPETFTVTVDNPSSDTYKITFVTTQTNNNGEEETVMHESDSISCTASANDLKWAIDDYFWSYYGSGINVAKVMYDADGLETTDSSLAIQSVYTVELAKRIFDISFFMSTVSVSGSTSTVDVSDATPGTPPIQGRFVINCPDWDGVDHYVGSMDYTYWVHGIN